MLITHDTKLDCIMQFAIDDCVIVLSSDLSNFIVIGEYFDFNEIPRNKKVLIVVGQKLCKNYIKNNNIKMCDFYNRIKDINPMADIFSYGDDECYVENLIHFIPKTGIIKDDYKRILRLVFYDFD